MSTRTAQHTISADPKTILQILTDPVACGRWTPIEFDTDLPVRARLTAGTRTRVEGRIAGQRARFELVIHRADEHELSLSATGPIEINASYQLQRCPDGTYVQAHVEVRGHGGLSGRILAHATDAVLAGGAISFALRRVAKEAEQLTSSSTPPNPCLARAA